MIPDIRKADSRGNAAGPAKRAKQRCLAYTVTTTAFQNIAGPVMFGKIERIIGRVPDSIPDSIVYINSLLYRIFASADYLPGIGDNRPVIAVYDGCWGKIFFVFLIHICSS